MTLKERTKILCECAVLLALSTALSFVKLWQMPAGGSVTLFSMLPVMLVSIKRGVKWGIGCAFLYSLIQLFQAIISGNVFAYCYTTATVLLCGAFDYIIPFTALGLSGVLMKVNRARSVLLSSLGIALCIFIRFVCHFISGVFIWGQWAPEGMSAYAYSFIYNGTFLAPELVITLAVAIILMEIPETNKLIFKK